MDEQLVIRLPGILRKGLEKAAKDDRRKLSDWIRITLEDVLEARKKGR